MKKIALFIIFSLALSGVSQATILFQENFPDDNFHARGWYDGTGGATISTTEHASGSTSSYECHFLAGATKCNLADSPLRMKFSPTSTIYVSFWVKHSSNWVGSGLSYHPHMFYILSSLDTEGSLPYFGDYSNLAWNYLDTYIEENQGKPVIAMQDGANVDLNNIGANLIGVTESRSIAGCNGTQTGIGQTSVDCYPVSTHYWDGMVWKGSTDYFVNGATKNQWHLVEALVSMNTVSGGIGQPDGSVKYWLDGNLEINHTNVIIRTGAHSTMQFEQIVFGPFIGDGSPADQYIWFDDLTVATSRPTQGTASLNPPTNFRLY